MPLIDVDLLAAPAFSVAIAPDGSFRYDGVNAANSAASGLSKEAFVGFTPHECMPPDIAARLVANYQRCVDSCAMQEYEEQLDVPAGHKWWRTTLSPVVDGSGRVVQVLGIVVDITERKRVEEDLRSAAFKDPLTGICNRRRFDRDLENAVARAHDTGRPFALILADINRFKQINDTCGHGAGDEVLKAVADRLKKGIRETDRLARIGGDEFAAIISAGSEGAIAVALDRLRRALDGLFVVGRYELQIGLSLGAALWKSGMSASAITATADQAMYGEKAARAA